MNLICCGTGCNKLVEVPVGSRRMAYCSRQCRDKHAAEGGLYLQGLELDHRPSCPGCGGSGVEDNDRWGGGLALCSWPRPDWARRCACGEHLMKFDLDDDARVGRVIELDQNGHRHSYMGCPDTPCRSWSADWRCTRGVHLEGPCALVPNGEFDHMVDAMRYAMEHAGAWRVPVIEKSLVDRWWFWVLGGAVGGGLGAWLASWLGLF